MLLNDEKIKLIEEKIGYTFKDRSLLCQAFTRASFCNENRHGGAMIYQSNEVLEFFGDGILSAAIITHLISSRSKRYAHGIKTTLTEGDFSNMRSKLSDKKNLSRRINELGLNGFLIMGKGDKRLGIEAEASVAEDLFESIIGAVYIDSDFNMPAVIDVATRMLDLCDYLKRAEAPMQSYKNALQEWCADKKRRLAPPIYEIIAESGPDHDKTYVCACTVNGEKISEGKGRSVKAAQSEAARIALEVINEK